MENCTTVWNPYLQRDINLVEKVQRRFTKRVPGLSELTYAERCEILNLDTLELRRLRNDLVYCFKMVRNDVNVDVHDFFYVF